RSIDNINRNTLVCIFLRILKYYQRIIFFTINRVKQIDNTIANKIYFKIKYNILNLNQKKSV
ncbi:hypothetical protein BDZ45DRAFT_602136, partial [Acephala macrosclerotiorum]